MIQGGMLPIFFFTFWKFDVIFLNFLALKASANLWKRQAVAIFFNFSWTQKTCKTVVKCCCVFEGWSKLGFWGSCTPEPGSSCWSTHRSCQQHRCWKYHTWHWHVWRTYPFKNCYKLNHVLTLWRNRSVTNPQKQTKSVRLMAGSRNCPVGLPLLKSKNTFRFVD